MKLIWVLLVLWACVLGCSSTGAGGAGGSGPGSRELTPILLPVDIPESGPGEPSFEVMPIYAAFSQRPEFIVVQNDGPDPDVFFHPSGVSEAIRVELPISAATGEFLYDRLLSDPQSLQFFVCVLETQTSSLLSFVFVDNEPEPRFVTVDYWEAWVGPASGAGLTVEYSGDLPSPCPNPLTLDLPRNSLSVIG